MRCLPALVALGSCARLGEAYRIKGSEDENKPFVPYEKGFVQNVQDPASAVRTRANQGYARSALLGDGPGKNRLFSCPQMVGPFDDDGQYHCRGPEYGYCDRRSGTCFCKEGYVGESCEDCAPTHFKLGELCYPKRVCPNDCSHAGECNYLTGSCECSDHREGDDCSKSKCSRFHQFCTHCNDEGCIECEERFSVHRDAEEGSQCEPCWRFDPRCRDCNVNECTSCVDLLLLSIHRSGRRPQDPPLPVDELRRELSITVPFGSRQEDAFYDAEHYFLVDPALAPLNESAVECHQGLDFDDSVTCLPYNLTSHIMCGNHGTITFESPEYAIQEGERQIRLTLQRSGGGVGEVSVSYSIYPITAGYEDVTSTVYYTANQTVVFRPGQIRASFLVSINDDRRLETNETFSIHLANPTGHARLGTQSRTIVTIIDDDEQKTCSNQTTLGHSKRDLGYAEAGIPVEFDIFAKTCAGQSQETGGDTMRIEAHKVGADMVPFGFDAPMAVDNCIDSDDGSYGCNVNLTTAGLYKLDVYQLVPGGLKGSYYTDNFLSNDRLDLVRTDAVVNFTWGTGAVTTFGRDFVSIRWEGYVQPIFSELYTFWLDIDDHARLWVDGILLIDYWAFAPPSGVLKAEHKLNALEPTEVVLEYRDVLGNATARLLWSSASTPRTAIPSSSLLYKEPIRGSPFSSRVLPTDSSAKETTAFGEGLYQGVAGQVHSFSIEPKDSFQNFRDVSLDLGHLDRFRATAELVGDGGSGLGNSLIPVSISYEKTPLEASYVPRIAGEYQLNITFGDGDHIFGSPFMVQVKPGSAFAPESIAFGGYGHCLSSTVPCSGIYNGMAGKSSNFTIQAYDLNRNKRVAGGDEWDVVASHSLTSKDYHIGSFEDHLNGTYTVSVTPTLSGPNDLTISLASSNIRGSPFRMKVVHGPVHGRSSFVVEGAHSDEIQMIAMTENTILVQATDEYGNEAIHSNDPKYGASFVVESEDIDDDIQVTHVGAGKYEIVVTPLKSGHIDLYIELNGSNIKGSPFNVTVHPGTFSASSSSASGSGISRATAGREANFIIQSKDDGGNSKLKDEAKFYVQMVLVERAEAPAGLGDTSDQDELVVSSTQEFTGNGQYLVKYTCSVTGQYLLHVRNDRDEEIVGSPFDVLVTPAAMSAPHSLVIGQGLVSGVAGEVAEVRVYGRDRFHNFVAHTDSVEKLEMSLVLHSRHQSDWEVAEHDSSDSRVTKQLAQSSGGGLFVLDYTPLFAGEYQLSVSTYSPGGMAGSYYPTQDLVEPTVVAVDEQVTKRWEDGGPSATKTHFGVSWNGKLAADHDEEYKIGVECNDGGYASVAIDGIYVPWQSCHPVMSVISNLKAKEAVNFSLRYKSLEGVATPFIKLLWEAPSVPLEVIPPRNLYHQVKVGDVDSYHPVITPNQVYPPQSVAVGDSLRQATSGVEHVFSVESRDRFGSGALGNLILDGGADIDVSSFHVKDEDASLQVNIVDNFNGTHTCAYTPRVAGLYFLTITVKGSHVAESPFLLRVEPGKTDPSNCILLGEDTISGVTGRELILELQAMDSSRNHRHKGGDGIIATLVPLSSGGPDYNINCGDDYIADGLYTITCPATTETGRYLLHIDMATSTGALEPIKGSPFEVTIFPGHAVPEQTQVTSGGTEVGRGRVRFSAERGTYASFVVSAKDLFGNDVNTGGEDLVGRVRGDTNLHPSERRLEVIDQSNGKYVFVYRVSQPSTYEVDVRMVTRPGLLGEYYANETSFKEGNPSKEHVNGLINFNVRRMNDDSLFTHVRWMGFVKFPHTGVFQMEVSGAEGECRLWIGDEAVLETHEESAKANFEAMENVLYEIKIESSLDINRLILQLFWSSRKMKRQLVPSSNLFSSVEDIKGSPFHLTVTE
ncbi:hypothetical protein ACHAWF_017014 [Thalassiosira exigua]